MANTSYRATGHLKPRESISESQRNAIANLASDGHGYRQIFALLRSVHPGSVTAEEVARFGTIAREHGCGVNNYRLLLDPVVLDRVAARVRRMDSDACPKKPSKAVLAAFLRQNSRPSAKSK